MRVLKTDHGIDSKVYVPFHAPVPVFLRVTLIWQNKDLMHTPSSVIMTTTESTSPTTTDTTSRRPVYVDANGSDVEQAIHILTKDEDLVRTVLLYKNYPKHMSYIRTELKDLRYRVYTRDQNEKEHEARMRAENARDYRKESRENMMRALQVVGAIGISILVILWIAAMAYTCTVHRYLTWTVLIAMWAGIIVAGDAAVRMEGINRDQKWTRDHRDSADRYRIQYILGGLVACIMIVLTISWLPESPTGWIEKIAMFVYVLMFVVLNVGSWISFEIMFFDKTFETAMSNY